MTNKYLAHFGIKGQKWGVRRFQNEDGSLTSEGKKRYGIYDRPDGTKDMKRLQKDAKKDAEEMARAKAYYGEGAGNRRKQIRNKISERMKDPDYKAEYEKHLANQDMTKHQKAANRERKIEDTKHSVARVGRGVKNFLLGAGTTSLTAIALVNVARQTGMDRKIASWGKSAMSSVIDTLKRRKSSSVNDYNWHPNRGSSGNVYYGR